MTKPFDKIAKKWSKNPEFQKFYDDFAPEFVLVRSLIEARVHAGLTQEELAEKTDLPFKTIARLESGHKPSLKTLERVAEMTGSKLMIQLVPQDTQRA